MKITNLSWLWPYRPHSFRLCVLFALVAYSVIATSYWASTAGIRGELQQLLPDYSAKRGVLSQLIASAIIRNLNEQELTTLKSISFDPPANFSTQRPPPRSELQDSNPITMQKVQEIATYQEFLTSRIKASDFGPYTGALIFAIIVATGLAAIARYLSVVIAFNPREIALLGRHPMFAVLMSEVFFWLYMGLFASTLIMSQIYAPTRKMLQQSELIAELHAKGPATESLSFYDVNLPQVLTIENTAFSIGSSPLQFSGEFVFILVVLYVLTAQSALSKRAEDQEIFSPMFGMTIPILSVVTASYFFGAKFLEGSNLTATFDSTASEHAYSAFDVWAGFHIIPGRTSLPCILNASAATLFFAIGLMLRSKLVLSFAHGGLIAAAGWIALSTLGYRGQPVVAIFALAAISFTLVCVVEFCARNLVSQVMYDPS